MPGVPSSKQCTPYVGLRPPPGMVAGGDDEEGRLPVSVVDIRAQEAARLTPALPLKVRHTIPRLSLSRVGVEAEDPNTHLLQ